MNNNVYGKTMKNLRNRIDVGLESHEKRYLKWKSKSSYLSQKYLTMMYLQYVMVKLH